MHRGPALMISGVLAVLAAVAVFIAIILLQFSGVARAIGWGLAAIAGVTVARAVWLGIRPPAVLKLDEAGFRLRATHGAVRASWLDVEKVSVGDVAVSIETKDAETITVYLSQFDEDRRLVLLRDLHDRLNTANGYERFTLG